jgi:hypothetical protein
MFGRLWQPLLAGTKKFASLSAGLAGWNPAAIAAIPRARWVEYWSGVPPGSRCQSLLNWLWMTKISWQRKVAKWIVLGTSAAGYGSRARSSWCRSA